MGSVMPLCGAAKPLVDHVISFGMGHFYISQSDKGGLVFGGDLDFCPPYAQRGNLPMKEHVLEVGMALMPAIGKARVLRSWGGSWICRPMAHRSSTTPI